MHESNIREHHQESKSRYSWTLLICLPLLMLSKIGAIAQDIETPQVFDPQWQVQPIATEPEIVTPVSCRFDSKGRLLVVESHTHFPPEGYSGPKTDRIYAFENLKEDAEGNVSPIKKLFYEGGTATMGLVVLDDGWIAVSTRQDVVKIRDSDHDGVADQRVVLLTLETQAKYPHNGLTGLAIGPDGMLYIGEGENLGEPYRLVASDGSVQVGHGEGGNIFRCTTEGKSLERVATGFWNPFGLYFDPAGRLWAVGNDPDARPPCRLLHVVPGGDYGFQFRFGRAGTHPLLAWDGELPGTLPMVAGTDEAPCAVTGVEDSLWVTSWGSHRIERFHLEPRGASWKATMDVLVQGNSNFRPVDMALAPDGSVYFTDWVDRSYPVHGKGRLWRLRKRSGKTLPVALPGLSAEEVKANRSMSQSEQITALNETDPFVCQAAVTGLVNSGAIRKIDWPAASEANLQLGVLMAWHWLELTDPNSLSNDERHAWIKRGLAADSTDVAFFAVRWAAERSDKGLLPEIESVLKRNDLTPALFAGVMSAIAYLESGSAARGQRDPVREEALYKFAADMDRDIKLRAMAIEQIPSDATLPTDKELADWIRNSDDRHFGGTAVRLLVARAKKSSLDELSVIALDENLLEQVRADALAGLSRNAGEYAATINKLALPKQSEVIRIEAQRVLRRGWTTQSGTRPQPHEIAAWDKLLNESGGKSPVNIDAGRRVFFRTTCANCHSHSGRGSRVGPDLSTIGKQMSRERLLESILVPSREVGPLFVPWRVLTVDGKVLSGMKLDKSGAGEKVSFLGAEGGVFEIAMSDIESWEPMKQSIMPDGLEESLSIEEFRDLVIFLMAE